MVSLASAARSRNLSRLELALVVIVIAVLMMMFMRRMERVEAAMERAMVQLVVQDLQSRLLMYKADLTISGREDGLADIIGANPVGTIIPVLGNYAGAYDEVDWDAVLPGQWVFDRRAGTLEYRVIHEDWVDTPVRHPARIRLRIEPRYVDVDGDGRYDPGTDRLRTVVLDEVGAYTWRLQ